MTILNNILAVSWHEFRVMCTRFHFIGTQRWHLCVWITL